MKIGYCQFSVQFGDKPGNRRKVETILDGVRADLVVLPELFATGYQFVDRKEAASLAETAQGETIAWARAMSEKIGGAICGGFAEKSEGRIFNSAFLVAPDLEPRVYRKIHLFDREKECFDPGDGRFDICEFRGVKLGMMICFDWVFPESMRTLAIKGAQVVCHPSNLVLPFCQQAMTVRCLENAVFAVTANRTGQEDRTADPALTFTGQSQITGPKGAILDRATADFQGVKTVDIDPMKALDKMITSRNDLLKDRRIEKYELGEG